MAPAQDDPPRVLASSSAAVVSQRSKKLYRGAAQLKPPQPAGPVGGVSSPGEPPRPTVASTAPQQQPHPPKGRGGLTNEAFAGLLAAAASAAAGGDGAPAALHAGAAPGSDGAGGCSADAAAALCGAAVSSEANDGGGTKYSHAISGGGIGSGAGGNSGELGSVSAPPLADRRRRCSNSDNDGGGSAAGAGSDNSTRLEQGGHNGPGVLSAWRSGTAPWLPPWQRRPKRQRLVWSPDLHARFLGAINQVGIANASPKLILEAMGAPGVTRENVASHLQKYRMMLKNMVGVPGSSVLRRDALERAELAHLQLQQAGALGALLSGGAGLQVLPTDSLRLMEQPRGAAGGGGVSHGSGNERAALPDSGFKGRSAPADTGDGRAPAGAAARLNWEETAGVRPAMASVTQGHAPWAQAAALVADAAGRSQVRLPHALACVSQEAAQEAHSRSGGYVRGGDDYERGAAPPLTAFQLNAVAATPACTTRCNSTPAQVALLQHASTVRAALQPAPRHRPAPQMPERLGAAAAAPPAPPRPASGGGVEPQAMAAAMTIAAAALGARSSGMPAPDGLQHTGAAALAAAAAAVAEAEKRAANAEAAAAAAAAARGGEPWLDEPAALQEIASVLLDGLRGGDHEIASALLAAVSLAARGGGGGADGVLSLLARLLLPERASPPWPGAPR